MASKKGLGRGIESLFTENSLEEINNIILEEKRKRMEKMSMNRI